MSLGLDSQRAPTAFPASPRSSAGGEAGVGVAVMVEARP